MQRCNGQLGDGFSKEDKHQLNAVLKEGGDECNEQKRWNEYRTLKFELLQQEIHFVADESTGREDQSRDQQRGAQVDDSDDPNVAESVVVEAIVAREHDQAACARGQRVEHLNGSITPNLEQEMNG